jgi:hypothetical protein
LQRTDGFSFAIFVDLNYFVELSSRFLLLQFYSGYLIFKGCLLLLEGEFVFQHQFHSLLSQSYLSLAPAQIRLKLFVLLFQETVLISQFANSILYGLNLGHDFDPLFFIGGYPLCQLFDGLIFFFAYLG